MKNVLLIFGIVIFSSFSNCDKIGERYYTIKLNNYSANTIEYYVASLGSEYIYPDTLILSSKLYSPQVKTNKSAYRDSSVPWEDVYKYLTKDTLSIYVFSSDTLNKYPWDTIRSNYMILQRYDLSLQDLQNRNFGIEYPYDITRGKLKVYKR